MTDNKKQEKNTAPAKTGKELLRAKIINEKTSFNVNEAYKALRTNIIFSLSKEDKCKRVMVSSSLASEGKSTTCANIAITFAQMGAKVCLIDCDLRRPNIGRLLSLETAPGVSNYLIDANTKEEIVHKNVRENLDVICSGDIPPNPAELIGSEAMDKLLDELSEEYEYIFIDSPPICVVTDPSVLASKSSGVVIVALQNSTEKDVIKTAVEQVEFVGAKLLGFVLNGVEYTSTGRYKYRYGYRYYHGLRGKHYERSYYYNSAYSKDKKPTANK
ncbi:MAG: CpsD/CapB family tyrosine-protein kinase [Clostridia bacterium]|nr:CpsD/CapB family tyrosine-protein kinase [Clostridia bacterium]